MTPSLNWHASQIAIDGSRSDLCVLLSARGSRLLAVCLGEIEDRGGPVESARHTIEAWENRRVGRCTESPSASQMAGCEAVTYVLERNNGERLREWKFEREGWLFVVGILLKSCDRHWVESLAARSLDSWEWIPGTLDTEVPQRSEQDSTEVTEIIESVTTTASPATVWALIRYVENNPLLHENLVEAYQVPGTPDGVGEEQSIVLKYPGYRRTVTSIVVEEEPGVRLVTRTHGVNDPFDRQIYNLERGVEGTRLTVSMRYSVGINEELRTPQATAIRAGIHGYLSRVADVLARGWTDDRSTPQAGA